MAGAKTVLALDGDIAKLIQKQDKVNQRLKEQNRLLKKTGRESKKAGAEGSAMTGQFVRGLGNMVTGLVSVGAAAGVFKKMIADVQELKRAVAETTAPLDVLSRQLAVQAGLKDPILARRTREAITRSVQAAAVPLEVGMEAGREMMSQGFDRKLVTSGGFLTTVLAAGKLKQGGEIDIEQFAGYLQSAYGEINEANARDALGRGFGAFKGTAYQYTHFPDINKYAAVARRAGWSPAEIDAPHTLLTPTYGSETTGMALKNIIIKSQAASGSPASVRALQRAGISPEEVDFEGESQRQVLDVYGRAEKRLSATQMTVLYDQLFGKRGGPQMATLVERRGELPQRIKNQMQGREDFSWAMRTLTTGPGAEAQRSANLKRLAEWDAPTAQRAEAFSQIKSYIKGQRVRGNISLPAEWDSYGGMWLNEFAGVSPATAVGRLGRRMPHLRRDPADAAEFENLRRDMQKFTEEIEQMKSFEKTMKDLERSIQINNRVTEDNNTVTDDNTRKVVSDPTRGAMD